MTRWDDPAPTAPSSVVYVLGWNLIARRTGRVPFHVQRPGGRSMRCGLHDPERRRLVPIRYDQAKAIGRVCGRCQAGVYWRDV